jgi:calcium-dependent protein kinase
LDFHCDGKINYHEFLAATISTIHFNKEEKLWSVFKYFDTNDTGYITAESVIDALKESGVMVNEEGLRDTFKELKKNGKSINFKEFKAIAFKSFGENEEDIDNKNNEKNFIKINYSNKNVEIENNLNLEKSNETSEIREIPED